MIIGILGRKGSGKTTFAKILQEIDSSYQIINFSDSLKQAVKILFGLDEEQVNGELKEIEDTNWKLTPRKIMQDFGTQIIRKNGFLYFGRNLFIESLKPKLTRNTIIADVRFQDEADFILSKGGILIKIFKSNDQCLDDHESETIHLTIDYHHCVQNDGTFADLKIIAQQFLSRQI